MEGNDTEALGVPCGAKKNPLYPVAVAQAEVVVSLRVSRWHQANLPFNPLALVLAVVEAHGTPL